MAAARFLVGGRVQGVFYRASAREQALTLGLSGYARNLPGGRVEVLASGTAAAIDEFERWLWRGPAAARVDAVTRDDCADPDMEGFHTG